MTLWPFKVASLYFSTFYDFLEIKIKSFEWPKINLVTTVLFSILYQEFHHIVLPQGYLFSPLKIVNPLWTYLAFFQAYPMIFPKLINGSCKFNKKTSAVFGNKKQADFNPFCTLCTILHTDCSIQSSRN